MVTGSAGCPSIIDSGVRVSEKGSSTGPRLVVYGKVAPGIGALLANVTLKLINKQSGRLRATGSLSASDVVRRNEDGSLTVPAALRPYMGGKETLLPDK